MPRPATGSRRTASAWRRVLARVLPPSRRSPRACTRPCATPRSASGKRIRPLLVLRGRRARSASRRKRSTPPAAAVELIHAYSLVHDDLPAMDDDDLRRGRPTTHRAFDEATAILAGDALQVLAFELLANDADAGRRRRRAHRDDPPARATRAARSAWPAARRIDLAATGQRLDAARRSRTCTRSRPAR